MKPKIHALVREYMRYASEMSRMIVRECRPALEAFAKHLLEHEEIDAAQVQVRAANLEPILTSS